MTESPTKSLGERREQGRELARECEGGRKVGMGGKGGEGSDKILRECPSKP